MNDLYDKFFLAINKHFTDPVDNIFKASGKVGRAKLAPCISNIYRRWYYSSLVDNTLLSPSILLEALNHQFELPPNLSPNIKLRNTANYEGLVFDQTEYSISSHPVVADFRLIISMCNPDIELTEIDQMPDELAYKAAKKLHIDDPYYAMYLLALAMEMEFLVKIPSIHVNRAQLVKNIDNCMDIPDNLMFEKIFSTTITYAARNISEIIPTPQPIFTESYLLDILKEPVETDVIFQRLYDSIGVNVDDLVGFDLYEEMDMLDMAVISGTYLLGIVLDRFFLTPFGYFLKVIRPLYMVPFDIKDEIYAYLDAEIEEDELAVAFFAPCSRYYLTELGLEYLEVKPSLSNFIDIKNNIPILDMTQFENQPVDLEFLQTTGASIGRKFNVYTLKIKYMHDPRLWINMEVSDIVNLHRLYLEIAYYFDLEKNAEYAFYPDKTENPFTSYSSPNQKKGPNKAADTVIGALNLGEKRVFMLTVNYPRVKNKEKWLLEVMKVGEGEQGTHYPGVTRIGKALRHFFD